MSSKMRNSIMFLLVLYLMAAKMSECGPLIEERNFGLEYPICNFSVPCSDPRTFCGSNTEVVTRWFVGSRCYPKKLYMGLCNHSVVCMSGICNVIAFGIGFCSY
ncbi:uncharacterized protein LOC124350178 [Daphnia pulicaria]|uniref:uncharacterized protein LOC124350178 n=1 Tax=Daphnia pulicaria TaxID=35523 RepID=UPI001EEA322D|nr:uncharacterized protein LOC124350178 [Daphnia pulicaria]